MTEVGENASGLRWRLCGSSTASAAVGLQLPVACGELRAALKQQMQLNALPGLDLLLSLEEAPEEVLPDSKLLLRPLCVLVQRKPAAAAAAALQEAELKFQQQMQQQHDQPVASRQQPPPSAAAPAEAAASAAAACSSSSNSSNSSNSSTSNRTADDAAAAAGGTAEAATTEDERVLLQAVMDVHDTRKGFLRGDGSSSSSRRGPGSHNLMWLRIPGESGSAAAAPQAYQPRGVGGSSGGAAAAVLAARQQQLMHQQLQQQQPYAAAAAAAAPVPPDYICHMCGEMGHHIKACPKSADAKQQKKIRPATGLPSSFLKDIPSSEIHKHREVYIKKDGSFAILKAGAIGGSSFLGASLDLRIQRHVGGSSHLKCGCCGTLFRSPTLTPCCGETFCRACIILYMQQHPAPSTSSSSNRSSGSSSGTGGLAGQCPGCNAAIAAADLTANTVLQQSVDTVTCNPSARWQWQQQQQQTATASAAAAAAGTASKTESPQMGSVSQLLSRTQRPAAATAAQDLAAAATATAATAAADTIGGLAKTAECVDEAPLLVKNEPETLDGNSTAAASAAAAAIAAAVAAADAAAAAGEAPEAAATETETNAAAAFEETERPDAAAEASQPPALEASPPAAGAAATGTAAATAAAATAAAVAPQGEEEETLPDIEDLLHFNIPVQQIIE
ncbi:hypothetical protein Esti_006683 [Eimeria stiedai]